MRSRAFSTVFCVFTLVLLSTPAASETEPCEDMDPEYDTCQVVEESEIMTWQESLDYYQDDPPWRDVMIDATEKTANISFDPMALNAGLMLKTQSSGIYEDQTEFLAVRDALLGVDVQELRNNEYEIVIDQSSTVELMEIAQDGESADVVNGSGDFLYDALSDVDGSIFVDGEMQTRGAFFDTTPCKEFGAGNWDACFRGKIRHKIWPFVRRRLWTDLYHFERNGKRTRRKCSGWWIFKTCSIKRIKADQMKIENLYPQASGSISTGDQWALGHSKTRNNTDGIKLGRSGNYLGGICGRGHVDDGGDSAHSQLVEKDLGGWNAPPCPL